MLKKEGVHEGGRFFFVFELARTLSAVSVYLWPIAGGNSETQKNRGRGKATRNTPGQHNSQQPKVIL